MTSILVLQHQRPDGEVDAYHLKAGRRYHLGRGSQCQVRILDLKLSRQHCAVEHDATDWRVVDLASTNGCAVDGERVAGSRVLRPGDRITAGSTTLLVHRIGDDLDPDDVVEQALPEAEPPRASERLAAAMAHSAEHDGDDLQPQSAPSRTGISDPLIPGVVPTPSTPPAAPADHSGAAPTLEPTPLHSGVDHDILATLPPGQRPAAAQPATEQGSRTFFINVLGRRVGPLTREQARQLKTRELRGTLTPGDLASVEAEAQAAELVGPASGPPEQATYYITLLGQRAGPLTRSQARELKARELRGLLTADEVARLTAR